MGWRQELGVVLREILLRRDAKSARSGFTAYYDPQCRLPGNVGLTAIHALSFRYAGDYSRNCFCPADARVRIPIVPGVTGRFLRAGPCPNRGQGVIERWLGRRLLAGKRCAPLVSGDRYAMESRFSDRSELRIIWISRMIKKTGIA